MHQLQQGGGVFLACLQNVILQDVIALILDAKKKLSLLTRKENGFSI